MLNLAYVFDDAIDVLSDHGQYLSIHPLPATIFLMQRDVINHYKYALNHYLPLSLNENCLQNSSIGTPYEKWAKFTNADFELVSKRIEILLQFTARMIHSVDRARIDSAMRESNYSDEFLALIRGVKPRVAKYQSPLGDLRYAGEIVGLRVEPENKVVLTRLSYTRNCEGKLTIEHKDGARTNKLITIDENGEEQLEFVSDEVARERMKVLTGETINISQRRTIKKLQKEGMSEVTDLEAKNANYAEACRAFLKKKDAMEPFEEMFAGWIQ